ncbi:MAG: hypothetical protein QGH40_03100, partial [bacterium]|nr:hypothetical protein [bacterium]
MNDKPKILGRDLFVIDEDNDLVFSSSLGSGILVKDLDVGDTENSTLRVTLNTNSGSITLNESSNITITDGADGTGSITFTGTVEEINVAFEGLRFSPLENLYGEDAADLSIHIDDQGFTGSGGFKTAQHDVQIDIRAVNDSPVLSRIETAPLSFEENGDSVQVSANLEVSDSDGNIAGASVKIVGHAPGDWLGIDVGPVAISGSYDPTTGILALTGDATALEYQELLRSVTYVSNSENPKTGTRSIVFRVNDGTGGAPAQSNEVSRQVAVAAVNDAPEIIAGSSATATEDTPLFFGISTGNEIAIIDLDKDLVEVDLSVNSGRINLNRVQGVEVIGGEDGTSHVLFSGLVRNVNTALAGLIYHPERDANGLSADLLQIKVEDKGNTGSGGVLKDDIVVQIHITSVNDAPVISAPSTATVAEGESITFSNSDETAVSIADIDAGVGDLELQITAEPGTVALSTISGLDGTGTGTGTLSYTGRLSDLNAALSDMVYTPPASEEGQKLTLNIVVSDLGNTGEDDEVQSATSAIHIGSTSVNDPPVISAPATMVTDEDTPVIFSSDGIERLAISDSDAGDEDMSFIITSVGTVTLGSTTGLTGQGNESGSMTYTGALADINNALDNLIFTPVADTSGVSAGRIHLFVSDLGHTGDTFQERTDTATVLIDIDAVNDAPVITAPVSAATNEDTPLNFGDSSENNISVSDIDVGNGTVSIDITANRAVSFQTVQGLTGSGDGTLALSYTGTLTAINAALSGMTFTP